MSGTPPLRPIPDTLGLIAVTYPDAAGMTGVSVDAIKGAVYEGALVPRYPSSRPVLLVEDLNDWLASLPDEGGDE